MARIDKEIIVDASVERVFGYITNPSNWPEVWPSLMEIYDLKPLPDGGYIASYVYKMAGMRFTGTLEFAELELNQWMVINTTGGILSKITVTCRSIEHDKHKTQVTLTIEYKIPVPLLGKLAEFVILKMNDQEASLVMNNLKLRFVMADY